MCKCRKRLGCTARADVQPHITVRGTVVARDGLATLRALYFTLFTAPYRLPSYVPLSFPFLPLPLPNPLSPSLPLKVGSLNTAMGSVGAL